MVIGPRLVYIYIYIYTTVFHTVVSLDWVLVITSQPNGFDYMYKDLCCGK